MGATLGAVLVGSGVASILTGVVGTQTVYYFQSYPDDKPLVKLMVAVVWFLDLLHTIMVLVSDWAWLIEHFTDVDIANWIPWPLGVTIVITALVTVIVHIFFAFRIHRLSKGNWFVVAPIVVLAFARLGFASTTCSKMLILKSFDKFVETSAWVFTMGLVTSSLLDIIVTSSLLWYLEQSRTGFDGMDQLINTLCRYTIEVGLLTCVGIVISLGFWLGMRSNLVFMAIHFVLAKLYANSLLATLNNRGRIRDRCGGPTDGAQVVFSLQRGHTLKRSTDTTKGMQAIQVNKEVYTKRDEETGITMASIQSQLPRKASTETSSTSKIKELFDDADTR